MECFITGVETPELMSFQVRQAGAFPPRTRPRCQKRSAQLGLLMDS